MSQHPTSWGSRALDFRRSDGTMNDLHKEGSGLTQKTNLFHGPEASMLTSVESAGAGQGGLKRGSDKDSGKLTNTMCILDPIRVPLKHGQLKEKERELMLQDSSGSEKRWWSIFVTFGRVPKTEMGAFLHIFQEYVITCSLSSLYLNTHASSCLTKYFVSARSGVTSLTLRSILPLP